MPNFRWHEPVTCCTHCQQSLRSNTGERTLRNAVPLEVKQERVTEKCHSARNTDVSFANCREHGNNNNNALYTAYGDVLFLICRLDITIVVNDQ